MNRNLVIILSVAALMIILTAGTKIYFSLKEKAEINKLPDYYQRLAKECNAKSSYNCCVSSVNEMSKKRYNLEPKEGCPKGFQRNMLKCEDTFIWCEPE